MLIECLIALYILLLLASLNKWEIEEFFFLKWLWINGVLSRYPTENIMLDDKILQSIPPKVREKVRMLTINFPFHHLLIVPGNKLMQEK